VLFRGQEEDGNSFEKKGGVILEMSSTRWGEEKRRYDHREKKRRDNSMNERTETVLTLLLPEKKGRISKVRGGGVWGKTTKGKGWD